MENFIVSARKYRPASFDMVVGQDTITTTLRSAIRNRHLAQAYLFCGPRGVGKTTCARIFAKTINCTNLGENAEACDKCESCVSFNTLRSFNIHELDAASNNKVEDIRSLNEQVRIPPQIGRYSIYIIDEVHMLSSSAFNAFLKTLEEPPSHAIFILATTEKHKIIPTILSRCQIFDFNRIRTDDIVKRLLFVAGREGVEAEEEALHIIAQKADGALRDALSIFDQIVSLSGKKIRYRDVIENLNVLDYEYYFRTTEGALNGDVSLVLRTFNEILDNGFDGHNFITGLNSHLRDILVSRDQSTIRLLEAAPAVAQHYMQQAAKCSEDFLFKALDIGAACDLNYKIAKNQRLHTELALIRMCRINTAPAAEPEKKKPEQPDTELTPPAPPAKVQVPEKAPEPKHMPVIEAAPRSFSIKDIIADEKKYPPKDEKAPEPATDESAGTDLPDFTPEAFSDAWNDFTDLAKNDGPRIVSMFKTIKPELGEENLIRIHLSNATQKDTFVLNYRQKLISFLESRFKMPEFDIETNVDLAETSEILYSDEQKYTYLFNKYPVLREMKRIFNLDLT